MTKGYLGISTSAKTSTISANKFTNDGDGGTTDDDIVLDNGAANVTISSNTFSANSSDEAINVGSDNLCTNLQILNNFWGGSDGGIEVGNITKSKIAGNTIQINADFIRPIHLNGAVTNTTVSGNTIYSSIASVEDAVDLVRDLPGPLDSNDTVTGNLISGGFTEGVALDGATGCTISSNTIRDCTDAGIDLEVDSDTNKISTNTITGCGTGINIGQSADSNTLSKNTANSNTNDGIDLASNGNTISSNIADYNKVDGIFVDGGNSLTSPNKLTANSANYNDNKGIELNNDNGSIASNNIADYNSYAGIDIFGCQNSVITGNTANYNFNMGFAIVEGFTNAYTKNIANHNISYGFSINETQDTVTSNTSTSNGTGFYIQGTNITTKNNVANSNVNDGFVITHEPAPLPAIAPATMAPTASIFKM